LLLVDVELVGGFLGLDRLDALLLVVLDDLDGVELGGPVVGRPLLQLDGLLVRRHLVGHGLEVAHRSYNQRTPRPKP
jgi:hypothetical protein